MNQTTTRGFTLIELMVAMGMASILAVAIVSAYMVQVRAKNTQEALTDMNQAARAAFEIMGSEIRMAGLDPLETSGARIIRATQNNFVFTLDRRNDGGTNQPDGDCCDGNEAVRYSLTNDPDGNGINNGGDCDLGRETGRGLVPECNELGTSGLQPLARNVDVLEFVYLDQNGAPIAYATLLTQAGRNTIRSVEITLVARAGRESGGLVYAYTNTDDYFNQQGQLIWTAPGDHFRRLRLATTINIRNLGML